MEIQSAALKAQYAHVMTELPPAPKRKSTKQEIAAFFVGAGGR